MTEDYLHYIWKFLKIDVLNLYTLEGAKIEILNNGFHNHNSGPDFLEAKIKIGETVWAGSVEIHIKSSDWDAHKHANDKAYNNVILHVVYEFNKEVKTNSGVVIPTLEIKSFINHQDYFQYENFLATKNDLPCENSWQSIPPMLFHDVLDNKSIERLERKTQAIIDIYNSYSGHWNRTFYHLLFRYFGMKVNGDPMYNLAKKLPDFIYQKEHLSILSVEAILYGIAGMLKETDGDEYYKSLKSEYFYLKQKYQLSEMIGTQWRFHRMRPANFPTLRIAQLSALLCSTTNLFDLIIDGVAYSDLHRVFKIKASDYWSTHYRFNKVSAAKVPSEIGDKLIENLIINVIAPLAFAYGSVMKQERYQNYALSLLEKSKFEKNKKTNLFADWNVKFENAIQSQALIELHDNYCSKKKCLNCKIGVKLLNSNG